MTYSAEPGHIESFRDATTNHEKMRGALFITFRCPDCGQSKSIKGRKSRGWKAGFRCAECHTKTEKSAGYAYEDARKEIHGKFSPIYVAPAFVCEEFKGGKAA